MKIVTTSDGSHTLELPGSKECYHSTHGAIQESRHVFIDAGLRPVVLKKQKPPVRVLEIGFGTGLNALLTAQESHVTGPIHYTTVEPLPLSQDLWGSLNYEDQLSCTKGLFNKLHTCAWGTEVCLTPTFTFHKIQSRVQDSPFEKGFDVLYFDAFSPDTQPDMWTSEVFHCLNRVLVQGGVLVTYCSKGIVKQCLREAGFSLERLPGPTGKRHMIRASKLS